jgi:hypothetical protein
MIFSSYDDGKVVIFGSPLKLPILTLANIEAENKLNATDIMLS